jgi:transcriptional regulator with XRE-family HTH domain
LSAGNAIRAARTKVGWSQDALAASLGTSHQLVSKWENGRVFPRMPTMQRIADLLGMDLKIEFVEKSDG